MDMLHAIGNALTGGGHVSTWSFVRIMLFMALTNIFDTSAFASRLAGVRSKRLSLSNTLYNMLTIGSRTATALYAPAIASIVDAATYYRFDPHWALQLLLLAATLGTACGIYLMPTLLNFYTLGIEKMDEYGTALRVMRMLFTTVPGWRLLKRCYQKPTWQMVKRLNFRDKHVPRDVFFIQSALYAFFTVGQIAAMYAGYLNPNHSTSAVTLSTAVNAVAAFLLLFLVDPRSAMIIDRGIARKIPLESVNTTMVMLAAGRMTGTLLSQLVFLPAAYLVATLATYWK
jgi:hypothetical protein